MIKKSCKLCPPEFHRHADNASKAALIDLVWDLLVKSHGEDKIGNGIDAFNDAYFPVSQFRGDKFIKVQANS